MRSTNTCTTRMLSRTLHAQHPVTTNLNTSPRFSPTIFYRDAKSIPTSTPFYSSIIRLYAQNPGFEIVREESVKFYLHMHNGIVQQNPLCVESCVTNGFSISPQLSPTMFDPDANSVLLRTHLCTAVDFMCRKACVRNCSRERKGLYNGNVQQNPLCAASCFTKDIPSLPGSRVRFFIAGQIQHRTVHRFLYTPAQVDAPMNSSRLYAKNPAFETVHEESLKVYHRHI